ncbi:MAG TPA: 2'-5' RNA ligase family protein [Ktedonobacterales bacterium]|nr:2'-5' RNA ligase family protein [Ktedonobacterales bacterium]
MTFPLYGVYLLPPTGLAASIDTLREELEQRFDCHASRNFMVHCTLKGFFRLDPSKSEEQLTQTLDPVISPFPSFQIQPNQVTHLPDAVIIDLASMHNPRLQDLHGAVYHHIDPEFVHPECPFTPDERKYGFAAHITLAFKDLTFADLVEAVEFAQQRATEGGLLRPFVGRTIGLYRFTTEAEAWEDRYRWWESLRYEALHIWRLRGGCLPQMFSRARQGRDMRVQYT